MEIIKNVSSRSKTNFLCATILLSWFSSIGASDCMRSQYGQPFEFLPNERFISHGQKHLHQLEKWSQTAPCWNQALKQFDSSCRHLTSVDQSRLAIALTNCHLAQSGHPTFPCNDKQPIEECTRPMDKADFIMYTEFFTNAISICLFIRNQRWQEDTEFLINQLSLSSNQTAIKLKQSLLYHQQILEKQSRSLQNQEAIIQNEKLLKDSIQNSTEDIADILSKANGIALENYKIIRGAFTSITDALQYLTSLQILLLGQFSTLYTGIYYSISIILAYLLTATTSTARARIWLYWVLMINLIFERLLTGIVQNVIPTDDNAKSLIYRLTWICRRIFIGIYCSVLITAYIKYRDYTKINNMLLEKIAKQNTEIKSLLNDASLSAKEVKKPPPENMAYTKQELALTAKRSIKMIKRQLLQHINQHYHQMTKSNRQLEFDLLDSGISDDCESDAEVKVIRSTKTPPRSKTLYKDTKLLHDNAEIKVNCSPKAPLQSRSLNKSTELLHNNAEIKLNCSPKAPLRSRSLNKSTELLHNDAEIKVNCSPKTPSRSRSVNKDTTPLHNYADLKLTSDRINRSPTHYNLRQQFGYKANNSRKSLVMK